DSMVELRSGDVSLFRGRMGTKNGRIAVMIEEEKIKRPGEP
ncbi:MAG: flagellar motor switch protein FliM, partial [Alphaproteobacteria bacterium]|nr:flagellar motor switch protein FliM [Alphaproteobacteria bacterium]